MHIPKRSFRYINAICAGLALLFCSGCATTEAIFSPDYYARECRYVPVRSPVQIDASAAVEAVETMTPGALALWKRWGNNDTTVAYYRSAVEQVLRNDLTTSGLFARIVTNDATKADYLVKAHWEDLEESFIFIHRSRVTLTATETATGAQVSSHAREVSLGNSDSRLGDVLPGLMADLKADLAADIRRPHEIAALRNASLAALLVSSDENDPLASEHNRAIIAAKNQQLPAILRDGKTDELSALVVKIEQTILDLDHECEVAKDRAQQVTATNGDARQIEELRGLAISYRERIELLKPILTALKEEIANRNR